MIAATELGTALSTFGLVGVATIAAVLLGRAVFDFLRGAAERRSAGHAVGAFGRIEHLARDLSTAEAQETQRAELAAFSTAEFIVYAGMRSAPHRTGDLTRIYPDVARIATAQAEASSERALNVEAYEPFLREVAFAKQVIDRVQVAALEWELGRTPGDYRGEPARPKASVNAILECLNAFDRTQQLGRLAAE